jgi:hypothetical protein
MGRAASDLSAEARNQVSFNAVGYNAGINLNSKFCACHFMHAEKL